MNSDDSEIIQILKENWPNLSTSIKQKATLVFPELELYQNETLKMSLEIKKQEEENDGKKI
jgi:hypothetical protein